MLWEAQSLQLQAWSYRPTIPYSGKLSREKTFMDQQEVTILWRKLSRNAKAYHGLVWTRPTFVEKTFVDGSKTAKFVNVFSLENVALYGNHSGLAVTVLELSVHPFKECTPITIYTNTTCYIWLARTLIFTRLCLQYWHRYWKFCAWSTGN